MRRKRADGMGEKKIWEKKKGKHKFERKKWRWKRYGKKGELRSKYEKVGMGQRLSKGGWAGKGI